MPELVKRTCSIDRESLADHLGQFDLGFVHGAQRPAAVECVADRRSDRSGGVTEQSRGVVAAEVDVPVAVDVDEFEAARR